MSFIRSREEIKQEMENLAKELEMLDKNDQVCKTARFITGYSTMKKLIWCWRRLENTTQIARLFRAMILNGRMMKSAEVRGYFDTVGHYNALTDSNEAANWNTVFRKEGEYHYITDEAMEYYNSI